MVDQTAEAVDGQASVGPPAPGFRPCGRRSAGGLDGRVRPCFSGLGVGVLRERGRRDPFPSVTRRSRRRWGRDMGPHASRTQVTSRADLAIDRLEAADGILVRWVEDASTTVVVESVRLTGRFRRARSCFVTLLGASMSRVGHRGRRGEILAPSTPWESRRLRRTVAGSESVSLCRCT